MNQAAGRVVGIDFGTTNSAIAFVSDTGEPVAIPNSDGETMTPSIVFLRGGRAVVGRAAGWLALEQPARAIAEIKREMGNRKYRMQYRGTELAPEAIAALILKKLKQYAEAQIGPIAGAVIAVPYYYDDTRRKATQDAGRIAGLNVLDIVNEPVASALCYAYGRGQLRMNGGPGTSGLEKSRSVLIYDLGGGTFDAAFVQYNAEEFRVRATDGDVRLGGTDWTRRLADWFAERFCQRFNFDPRTDAVSHVRLLRVCEEAKHELSSRPRSKIKLDWNGQQLEQEIARGEFEALTADLLMRTETTTRDVLDEAGVTWDDLAEIIPVGGASKMPMVAKMLERTSGWLIDPGVPASEPVALGAAIHAEILQGATGGRQSPLAAISQVNVNSHSLGIAVHDPQSGELRNEVMIRRNSPLPHAVTRSFRTVVPQQHGALVQVLEGEAADPEECVLIGKCLFDQLPHELPVGSPIEISYSYGANGRVHVHARDLVGGRTIEADIFRHAGMEQRQVQLLQEFVAKTPVD